MSAEKMILYKAFAIWSALDNEGIYFEITDKTGQDIFTSLDSYATLNEANQKAKAWIDRIAPEGQP
jgi:hypothetical protein